MHFGSFVSSNTIMLDDIGGGNIAPFGLTMTRRQSLSETDAEDLVTSWISLFLWSQQILTSRAPIDHHLLTLYCSIGEIWTEQSY
jgi:hypothetical protein